MVDKLHFVHYVVSLDKLGTIRDENVFFLLSFFHSPRKLRTIKRTTETAIPSSKTIGSLSNDDDAAEDDA